MKKINSIRQLLLLSGIILSILILASCQEDEAAELADEPSENEQTEIFSNATEANNLADEEVELSYLAQINTKAGDRSDCPWRDCVTIERDSVNKVVTIDFGEGCQGPMGRTRRGKIIITYDGEFDDRLANRVITFEDYFVNARQITGTIELRDINRNQDDNITATRRLVDFTIIYRNDNQMVINGSTTREWLEGEGDEELSTNIYSLTGSYEGVSTRGREFTYEIVEPVIVSFPCRAEGGFPRIQGIIEMTMKGVRGGERTRRIDYGDGTCDNEHSVTID